MNNKHGTKRILIIGQKSKGSSGGNQVRNRNYDFLTEFFGVDNTDFLYLTHEVFGSKSRRDFGLVKIFFKYVYDCVFVLKLMLVSFTLGKYFLVYFDQSNLCFSKWFARNKRKIFFFHNIESSYLDQMYKNKSSYEKRFINSIFRTEQWIVNNADICITISESDSFEMEKLYGKRADYVLPVSMNDCNIPADNIDNSGYMLFVGSDFYGNTEGLFWFIENCMGHIDKKLLVVGNRMEKYKEKYNSGKIEFLGFVEDLGKIYQAADFVILPILSGGGMKVKTCEALMYGKRIVGTKKAFEGYNCVDGENCFECDSANEFIDCINYIDSKDIPSYSQKNREFFLENYEDSVVKENFYNYLKNSIY